MAKKACPPRRHGHVFFPLGVIATPGWGAGGGIYPPTPKNFACGEQKKKKVAGFSQKSFLLRGKNCHTPPQPVLAEGMKVLGGVYTPIPPHGHVCLRASGHLTGADPDETRLSEGAKGRKRARSLAPLCALGEAHHALLRPFAPSERRTMPSCVPLRPRRGAPCPLASLCALGEAHHALLRPFAPSERRTMPSLRPFAPSERRTMPSCVPLRPRRGAPCPLASLCALGEAHHALLRPFAHSERRVLSGSAPVK